MGGGWEERSILGLRGHVWNLEHFGNAGGLPGGEALCSLVLGTGRLLSHAGEGSKGSVPRLLQAEAVRK